MNLQGMAFLPCCTLSPASFSLCGPSGQVLLSNEGHRGPNIVVHVILSILLTIASILFSSVPFHNKAKKHTMTSKYVPQ